MSILKNSWQLIALSVILLLGASCDDNNKPKPLPDDGTKDLLIGTILPNPDGFSGAAYMQAVSGIEPADYDNSYALEATYSCPPIIRGNEIYVLPGWGETSNLIKVYALENNKLQKTAEIELPSNTGANAMEVVGDKIYVSFSFMGKIGVIDKTQHKLIKEIDISSYAVGDNNPDPCQMIGRDGVLYVALQQMMSGKHAPDPNRKKVDVLLIDTKTDEPIKMITNETAGMSGPTKSEADDYSMFMDEKGDIYINCLSGFGSIGHKAGFLRIKKGEMDFDSSYEFDLTSTAIEGESERASYIVKLAYAGNATVYACVCIPAYYSPKPDYFKDMVIFPVKINLETKTIKHLGELSSNNFGACVGLYKDKVLFGLATKNDKGFYVYDTQTGKMSENAVIKVKGYPYLCLQLKN